MGDNIKEKDRDPNDGLRPWSAITHGIGILLSVIGLVYLIYYAWRNNLGIASTAALIIYGSTMTALYTASTLYHSLKTGVKGRIALRKLDHLMIYFLIAGTYTPLCVIALNGGIGKALLSVIWGLALIGSIVNLIWIKLPRWLTTAIYLAMGWLAIIAIKPLYKVMGGAIAWLIIGGVIYTVGGVLYAIKRPGRLNPRFGCHEVFHLFILAGSVCHYVLMLYIPPTFS